MFVDVHSHLDSYWFDNDRDEVIQRAAHVTIVAAGVNPETNRAALALHMKHKNVQCSLGIYPKEAFEFEKKGYDRPVNYAPFDIDKELAWIEEQVKQGNCIGIGEIGLDFVNIKDKPHLRALDEELFVKQLRLAKKYKVPVIVHTRKAEERVLDILEKEQMQKVVLHAFGGRKSLVKRIKDNGWSCSIPPLVFRSLHFQMIVQELPLEQLLTETDAPYLGLERGERNEPKNVIATVQKIAELRGISPLEAETIIYSNFLRLTKRN